MKRTSLMVMAVVACAAVAGVALAQHSKQSGKQPLLQHTRPGNNVRRTQPAQEARGKGTPTDPEGEARYRKAIEPTEHSLRTAQDLYRSGDLVGAERAARETITLAAGLSPLAQELARRLVGQIRMQQGRYKDALEWLGADWLAGKDARLDLDIALCYVRLGNYTKAKRFYSDKALLRYTSIQPEDLPGASNPQSLEASILLARGLDKFFTASGQMDALSDLNAAGRLAPRNGLISYYAGMSLVHMDRPAEAAPYFRRAAQYGRGKIAQDAQKRAAAYK
jgi:tetratricopeptide (TPR) repeat protein